MVRNLLENEEARDPQLLGLKSGTLANNSCTLISHKFSRNDINSAVRLLCIPLPDESLYTIITNNQMGYGLTG